MIKAIKRFISLFTDKLIYIGDGTTVDIATTQAAVASLTPKQRNVSRVTAKYRSLRTGYAYELLGINKVDGVVVYALSHCDSGVEINIEKTTIDSEFIRIDYKDIVASRVDNDASLV